MQIIGGGEIKLSFQVYLSILFQFQSRTSLNPFKAGIKERKDRKV